MINNDCKISQFLFICQQCHFPDFSFFTLTVSDNCKDTAWAAIPFERNCHTTRHTSSMSETSGRNFDSRHPFTGYMAGIHTAVCIIFFQFRTIKKTAFCKSRINGYTCMSFTKHKTVSCLHFRIFTIIIHHIMIKHCHNIDNRQYGTNMCRMTVMNHLNSVFSHC